MLLPFAIFWSGLFALGNGLERAFFERMQASEASRYITTADLSCTLVHGFVVFVVGLGIALTEDPMYPGMTSWQRWLLLFSGALLESRADQEVPCAAPLPLSRPAP